MKNNGFAGEYEEGDDWAEKEERELLDNGFSKPYVASIIHEMKKAKKRLDIDMVFLYNIL